MFLIWNIFQKRENMHVMRRNRNLDSHEVIPDFEKKDVLGIDYYDQDQVEGYRKYYNNPGKQKIPVYKSALKSHIEIKKIYEEDSEDLLNKQVQHLQQKQILNKIQNNKKDSSDSRSQYNEKNKQNSQNGKDDSIIEACFYGENCRVDNCPYQHPLGKYDFNQNCKFGDKCIEYPNCYFKHPNKPHIPKVLDDLKKKSIKIERAWNSSNTYNNNKNSQKDQKFSEEGYISDDDGYEIIRKKKYPTTPCPFGEECPYKNNLCCDFAHEGDKKRQKSIQKNILDNINEKAKKKYSDEILQQEKTQCQIQQNSDSDSKNKKQINKNSFFKRQTNFKSQQVDVDDYYEDNDDDDDDDYDLNSSSGFQNKNFLQVQNSHRLTSHQDTKVSLEDQQQKRKKMYFQNGWDLDIPILSSNSSSQIQQIQQPPNSKKNSTSHLNVQSTKKNVPKTLSENINQGQSIKNSQNSTDKIIGEKQGQLKFLSKNSHKNSSNGSHKKNKKKQQQLDSQNAQKILQGSQSNGENNFKQIRLQQKQNQLQENSDSAKKNFQQKVKHGYKVIVNNIPYKCTDQDLNNFFKEILNFQPAKCYLIYDRETGVSRGFGFADFSSIMEQNLALQLDGYKLGGRKLKIQEA
ncbi:hypothetical protein PPERSA_01092 [Pseudocohnilembus persalinus]|uniref:RRM domain-containing protein n=1 Tax=Pseudocohnilembus persalinus TaxID=266149 RepID=A0A0V0QUX3_PSEPJ|nr:hypothetical protein PPERSA_01092 [Pseudocohnilembus persalinus]|eukprot:KRX06014.1 hypothetical protein PPERSA_01092 [Pseudocohnilembus persalinus]